MDDAQKTIELNKKLIALLDDLLDSGDWESSLFLRASVKNFRAFRQRAENLLQQAEIATPEGLAKEQQQRLRQPGQRAVFIAVYQTAGNQLQKWQMALRALDANMIGRPVYSEESHVIQALRSRGNSLQEGYVAVYVAEADILVAKEGEPSQDRLGHALLSLKEGAVNSDNIHVFVHANQNRYAFIQGQLVPLQE